MLFNRKCFNSSVILCYLLFFLILIIGNINALKNENTIKMFRDYKLLQHLQTTKATAERVGQSGFGPPCPVHPAVAPLPDPLPKEANEMLQNINTVVQKLMGKYNLVGLSWGVVYDQRILFSEGLGLQDKSTGVPATPDSVFRVGSITKVLTDLMLMRARDEGILNLDDEITKYFPSLHFKNKYENARSLTFRELATQISGIPGGEPCSLLVDGNCDITLEEAFEGFSKQNLIYPPNQQAHYADSAFALIGRTVEKLMNVTYEDYVVENLTGPLGMKHTGFNFSAPFLKKYLATGYNNGTALPEFIAKVNLGWASPTGQAYMSVNDLMQLVKFYFRGLKDLPDEYLDGATIRELLLPVFPNDDKFSAYGFPLEIYMSSSESDDSPFGNYWLRTKGGRMPGYSSMMIMIPEIRLGVVALANDNYAPEIAITAAEMLIPGFDNLLYEYRIPPPNPGNLSSYIGCYEYLILGVDPMDIEINAYNNTGQLYTNLGGTTVNLTYSSNNDFIITIADDIPCLFEQIGINKSILTFDVDNEDVKGLSMYGSEPYYGILFKKKNSGKCKKTGQNNFGTEKSWFSASNSNK